MIYSDKDLFETLFKLGLRWTGRIYSPRFNNYSNNLKKDNNFYGFKCLECVEKGGSENFDPSKKILVRVLIRPYELFVVYPSIEEVGNSKGVNMSGVWQDKLSSHGNVAYLIGLKHHLIKKRKCEENKDVVHEYDNRIRKINERITKAKGFNSNEERED